MWVIVCGFQETTRSITPHTVLLTAKVNQRNRMKKQSGIIILKTRHSGLKHPNLIIKTYHFSTHLMTKKLMKNFEKIERAIKTHLPLSALYCRLYISGLQFALLEHPHVMGGGWFRWGLGFQCCHFSSWLHRYFCLGGNCIGFIHISHHLSRWGDTWSVFFN